MLMTVRYFITAGCDASDEELQIFRKLLLLQDQVDNPSIDKIKSCPYLCIAYDEESAIGIGAIKDVYKIPFKKAKVSDLRDKYNLELGYIFVLDNKEYRGRGIGRCLCETLLLKIDSKPVFATTEESGTNPMKHLLVRLGFSKAGQTYVGARTKKHLGLYIK